MRLVTAGESHGPGLIAVLDGVPVGLRAVDGTIVALGPSVAPQSGDEVIDGSGLALVAGDERNPSRALRTATRLAITLKTQVLAEERVLYEALRSAGDRLASVRRRRRGNHGARAYSASAARRTLPRRATSANTRAALRFTDDGSILRLNPSSQVRLTAGDDRNALVFPFTHIGGIGWLFSALVVGFPTVYIERFDPKRASLRTYLYAAGRNLAFKHFRQTGHEIVLDELEEELPMIDRREPLQQLLEEELALLRGVDGFFARPVYNRLFWNLTTGEGEAAYAQNYNLSDVNFDGFIDERDAQITGGEVSWGFGSHELRGNATFSGGIFTGDPNIQFNGNSTQTVTASGVTFSFGDLRLKRVRFRWK